MMIYKVSINQFFVFSMIVSLMVLNSSDLLSQSNVLNADRSARKPSFIYPKQVEFNGRVGVMIPGLKTSKFAPTQDLVYTWNQGNGGWSKGYVVEGTLNFVGKGQNQSKLGFAMLGGISYHTLQTPQPNAYQFNQVYTIKPRIFNYELGGGPSFNHQINDKMQFNGAIMVSLLVSEFWYRSSLRYDLFQDEDFRVSQTYTVGDLFYTSRISIEGSMLMNVLVLGVRFSFSSLKEMDVYSVYNVNLPNLQNVGNDSGYWNSPINRIPMHFTTFFVGFRFANH